MLFEVVARAAVGLVLLAWLPGYAWRRHLLPSWSGAAAFVADVLLSVALVILGVLAAHQLLGAPVNEATAVWVVLAVTLAAFAPAIGRRLERLDLKLSG